MKIASGVKIDSPLFAKICQDFVDAHMLRLEQANAIEAFCAYAADWLKKRGVVGVGHVASGLALRLADGTELGLLENTTSTAAPDSVPLTGTAEKLSVERPKADLSVSITGR
jgi:hypothetical protein